MFNFPEKSEKELNFNATQLNTWLGPHFTAAKAKLCHSLVPHVHSKDTCTDRIQMCVKTLFEIQVHFIISFKNGSDQTIVIEVCKFLIWLGLYCLYKHN